MKGKKILLGLVTLASILTACANTDQKADSTEEEASDSLKVAMTIELDSLDPFLTTAGDTKTYMDQVFDGLFDIDEDGNLVGDLAKSYEISEDGLVYDFSLKEGVKFHDGSDFSADDVYYTFDKLAGITSGEPLSSNFSIVKDLEVISPTEIKLSLEEKNNSFIYLLTQPIVKKDYEDNATKPIGTGPFSFVSYTPGEGMKLKRNEDYHNKDHVAKFENVEIIRVPDSQSLVLALNNKDIDLATGLTYDQIDQLEGVDLYSKAQNLVQVFGLNNEVKPFDDIRVRQAIAHAINKEEIVDVAAGGRATILYSSFSPALAEYFNDLGELFPYDVEKSKALLKEAGLEEGFSFTLTVPSDYRYHMDTAELIQAQLAEVGIEVTLDPIEFSTWLDKVYANKDYESTVVGFIGYIDPIRILDRYKSDNSKNYLNYKSEEYDKAIEEAKLADSDEKLTQEVKRAQEIIAEDVPGVFLTDPDSVSGLNDELTGLKTYPVQKVNLEDISIKND
ncbi:MAG: ABC transporter substrate-binding protein [Anaerococcus sp.]|nr:ABC transporter substrate-binding protein [Anaerococcus sp.]